MIQLFLLSQHYRSPVDFSEDSLSEANSGLNRFYSVIKATQDEIARPPSHRAKIDAAVLAEHRQNIESFQARIEEAMDDDFNTAQALAHFYDLQTHLNSLLNLSKGHPTEEIISLFKQGSDYFSKLGWIFGLFREDPAKYLEEQKKEGLKKLTLSEEEILKLIEERNVSRKSKNWKRADEIRNDLLSKGIFLEDISFGTSWKLK